MNMKQVTAKGPIQVLEWIDTQPHHFVGCEFDKSIPCLYKVTHTVLKNYHEKLRVPIGIWESLWEQIELNRRPFDSRMHALTRKGRRNLNNFKKEQANGNLKS
jgi:hypothetical protein